MGAIPRLSTSRRNLLTVFACKGMAVKILDNSGDKRYFTIVPNYILNHSTAIDQALYLQMKRLAGDEGLCFAT
jgi:hypothetical protein